MEEIKVKKFIQKTDSHLKTKQLFEGDVHCYKCGQVQTYEGLMNNGECCNCGISLIGELF